MASLRRACLRSRVFAFALCRRERDGGGQEERRGRTGAPERGEAAQVKEEEHAVIFSRCSGDPPRRWTAGLDFEISDF